MKVLIASLIRKLIFGAGAVWLAKLVELGILQEADGERIVQILAAAAMVLGAALWSYIKRKIDEKK